MLARVEFIEADYENILFGSFDMVELIKKESAFGEPDNPNRPNRRVIVTCRSIKDGGALVTRFNQQDFSRTAEYVAPSEMRARIADFRNWDFTVMVCAIQLLENTRLEATGTCIYTCIGHPDVDSRNIHQLTGRFRGPDSKVVAIVASKSGAAFKQMKKYFDELETA